eukprot:scaffold20437_cov41-Attheya_sp.AAC.3
MESRESRHDSRIPSGMLPLGSRSIAPIFLEPLLFSYAYEKREVGISTFHIVEGDLSGHVGRNSLIERRNLGVDVAEERRRGPLTYFHDILSAISVQFERHAPRGTYRMGADAVQTISGIQYEACLHCGSKHCFEDVVRYNVSTRAHITEGGQVRHPGCTNQCNSPRQTLYRTEPPRDGGVVNGGASVTIFLVVE